MSDKTNNESEKDKNWIMKFAGENWWRILLFLLLTANLWLSQSYVTRAEYKADKDGLASSVARMNELITGLEKQLAVMVASSSDKRVAETLADHEARLREVERFSSKRP